MAVTVRQVAEIAGVSRSTANMILTGRVETYATETCERVIAAAKQLSYRPNIAAKSLKNQRSYLIGAIYSQLNAPYMSEFLLGLQTAVTQHGCAPTMFVTEDPKSEVQALSLCESRRVDGLIVNLSPGPNDDSSRIAIDRLRDSGMPIIEVFGRSFKTGIPSVITDAYLAGRRATQKMLDLGSRRNMLLLHEHIDEYTTPTPANWFTLDFFRGYTDAMRSAGEDVWFVDYNPTQSSESFDRDAFRILSEKKPDGIITLSRGYAERLTYYASNVPGLANPKFVLAGLQPHLDTRLAKTLRVLINLPITAAAIQAVQQLFEMIDGREGHDLSLSPSIEVLQPTG